jgi:hypothetical protein
VQGQVVDVLPERPAVERTALKTKKIARRVVPFVEKNCIKKQRKITVEKREIFLFLSFFFRPNSIQRVERAVLTRSTAKNATIFRR